MAQMLCKMIKRITIFCDHYEFIIDWREEIKYKSILMLNWYILYPQKLTSIIINNNCSYYIQSLQ